MTENIRSVTKLGFNIVAFIVSLLFFSNGDFGSFIVNSMSPNTAVGSFSYESLSKFAELALSIATMLISSGVFGKSKWLTMIVEILGPFFQKEEPLSVEEMFQSDVIRMIKHAIATKNSSLTVMLAEELAGCHYITEPEQPQPEEQNDKQTFPQPPAE